MADPTWFVDFSFAEKDPVSLAGAPADCKLAVMRPGEGTAAPGKTARPAGSEKRSSTISDRRAIIGAKFANRIAVKCP